MKTTSTLTLLESAQILFKLKTFDDSGRHFTDVYDPNIIDNFESLGYIIIHRPVDSKLNKRSMSIELTQFGLGIVALYQYLYRDHS